MKTWTHISGNCFWRLVPLISVVIVKQNNLHMEFTCTINTSTMVSLVSLLFSLKKSLELPSGIYLPSLLEHTLVRVFLVSSTIFLFFVNY